MMKETLFFLFLFFTQQVVFGQNNQVLLSESFSGDISHWTRVDGDGDGKGWTVMSKGVADNFSIGSLSNDNGTTLTPNNWLISPIIEVPTLNAEVVTLSYYVGAVSSEAYAETYRVYIKEITNESEAVNVNDYTKIIYSGVLKAGDFTKQTVRLSSYAGKKVRIAFRHVTTTSQSGILLDDILVEKAGASDLLFSTVLSPVDNKPVAEDLDIAVEVVNQGEYASSVGTITCQVAEFVVTESLPSIQPGGTLRHIFSQKIPAYAQITTDETAYFTISSDNDLNTTNNTTTSTYTVLPWNYLTGWGFETEEERTIFKNEFTKVVQDNGVLLSQLQGYFPNNIAWSLLRADPENFPVDMWGETFLASSSTYTQNINSDRWLITPKINLDGSQLTLSCVSATYVFGTLAQNESYEVLVSDKTTALGDFVKIGETVVENGDSELPYRRLFNLSAYAGKDIYIAFRLVTIPSGLVGLPPTMLMLDNISVWTDKKSSGIENVLTDAADAFIQVYPNPAKDVAFIKSEKDVQSVSIYNAAGKIVLKEQGFAANENYQINISSLPGGVYLIKAETEDGKTLNTKLLVR